MPCGKAQAGTAGSAYAAAGEEASATAYVVGRLLLCVFLCYCCRLCHVPRKGTSQGGVLVAKVFDLDVQPTDLADDPCWDGEIAVLCLL